MIDNNDLNLVGRPGGVPKTGPTRWYVWVEVCNENQPTFVPVAISLNEASLFC